MGRRLGLVGAVSAALVLMDGFGVPYWAMISSLPLLGAIAVAGYYTRE